MESIITLTTELKSSVKGKRNKAVSVAVGELSTIIISMQSGNPSLQELRRINIFFKDELMPLYRSCTECTLQLAAKVLEHSLSVPLSGSKEAAALWNSVSGSVATGILNFLETDKKFAIKPLIARCFYDTICAHCFPDSQASSNLFEHMKATTLTPIYQMLSDTVVGQAENQSILRNSARLGGERIGLALAGLQDFLPIEALLELFANLLPSAKAPSGIEKRIRFIKQVFNPAYFPNHQEIVGLLDTAVISDWNVTSLKISDMIASRNPSYPQPFETKEVVVDDSKKYSVERIYVDGSGFLASIDEGDSLGTLQLPYHQVEQFSISEPLDGKAVVTVTSKIPPIINQQFVPRESRSTRCIWEIQSTDVPKILQALKHRRLGSLVNSYQRKVSLAGAGIELSNVHPSISTQTKEKDISSLWSNINPTDMTSPLLPAPKCSKSLPIAAPPQPALAIPLLEASKPELNDVPSTIVARQDGSCTVGTSVVVAQAVPGNGDPVPSLTSSEPEPSPSQVVRKVTRRHKEALVVRSDTEAESPPKPIPKKVGKGMSKQEAKATTNLVGIRIHAGQSEGDELHVEPAPLTHSTTRALTAGSDTSLPSPPEVPARKYKRAGSELDDEDDDKGRGKPGARPAKRPRLKQQSEEPTRIQKAIPKAAERPKARKPPIKRYWAKNRASSPSSRQEKPDVDFDTIISTTKTVVTRMKARDGKAALVKPKAVKPHPVRKEDKTVNRPEVVPAGSNAVPRLPKQVKVEEVNKGVREEEAKKPESKKPHKTKKAPWNDPTFIHQIETSKSEMDTSSMRLLELQQDYSVAEIDMRMWESTSPSALASLRTPKIKKVQEDAEMIDLTKDDSPPDKENKAITRVMPLAKSTPRESGRKAKGVHNLSVIQAQTDGDEKGKVSRPLSSGRIASISVDVGVQADFQELSPATPAPNHKIIVPSLQSVRKIQPLVVKRKRESFVAPVPLLKDRPGPIRVSAPQKIPRARNSSAATSSKGSHSTGKYAPETLNGKIVDVLNEINDAILHKIDSKFEGVRSDLGMTRQHMLVTTRKKLDHMRLTSVGHYNALVMMYEKYTTKHQENSELFDELKRASQEALEGVSGILLKHNRQSLSRKFPRTMFTNVPSLIKNSKQVST